MWVGLKNKRIILRGIFRKKSFPLEDLSEIQYHYQAVVGFDAVWELCFQNGEEVDVSQFTFGLKSFLRDLENHLDGFSVEAFYQAFEAGDVEDTLILWKKNNDET